jgi:hypothetical protein
MLPRHDVTQTHLDNLAKLQSFLLTNDVLIEMENFRTVVGDNSELKEDEDEDDYDLRVELLQRITKDTIEAGTKGCGTAGCAVGWAPFIITPEAEDYYSTPDQDGQFSLRFWHYVEKHLLPEAQMSSNSPSFSWMFDSDWSHIDNTRHGAAYRIAKFIDESIDGFHAQNPMGIRCENEVGIYLKVRDAWLAKQGSVS